MPSDRSNWRKLIGWLGPVLLASLGLHALLLVVPLPEPEAPEEVDIELPDPIQVTELPQLEIPEPPSKEPPAAFIPEPAPVIEDSPPPAPEVSPPPVVEAPPPEPIQPDPPEPEQPEPPELDSFEPEESFEKEEPVKEKEPATPSRPAFGSTYSATGTTRAEKDKAGRDFITRNVLIPKNISSGLQRTYSVTETCLDEAVPATAVVAFVINEFGDIRDAEVIQKTGYPEVDNWMLDAMLDPDDAEDFVRDITTAYLDEINPPGSRDEPLIPVGDTEAAFQFEVAVTIDGDDCDSTDGGV